MPNCEYECSERGSLKQHIMAVHEKLKPFNCQICEFKCSEKANLKKHSVVHENKNYSNAKSVNLNLVKEVV
jgi:hypothetical protein